MPTYKYFVDYDKVEGTNNYSAILIKDGKPIKTLYLGTNKKDASSFTKLNQAQLAQLDDSNNFGGVF